MRVFENVAAWQVSMYSFPLDFSFIFRLELFVLLIYNLNFETYNVATSGTGLKSRTLDLEEGDYGLSPSSSPPWSQIL